MDRVLSSFELVDLILSYDIEKKTLAGSARVCRSWFEPAVRNLWKFLDRRGVSNLFRLLPNSREDPNCEVIYNARKNADWSRFDFYARFVKNLCIKFTDNDLAIHNTLARLAHVEPRKCLTPNICDLRIQCCETNFFLDHLFFVRPNIHHLAITDLDELSHYYDTFNFVLPRTPNLVSLIMCVQEQDGHLPFQDDFISALGGLESLEDFISEGFNYSPLLFSTLATLPNLKNLDHIEWLSGSDVEEGKPDQSLIISAKDIRDPFPCLKEFRLESHMANVDNLLAMRIRLPNIENLDARFEGDITEASLRKSFRRLALEWSNLSDVEICLNLEGESSQEIYHFSAFRALSDLCRLKNFHMYSSTPIAITDDELGNLIQNWKELTDFNLGFRDDHKSPQLTLSVLTSFAIHCESIKNISIGVDARKKIVMPSYVPVMRRLEEIEFGLSPILDTKMVILVLGRVCPSTCQIVAEKYSKPKGKSADANYQARWDQVSKSIKSSHI